MYDFITNETSLHGWVAAPPDKNDKDGCWSIFVFCCLRDVLLPPEFLSVHSVICGALALGDLLMAVRCSEDKSLSDVPGYAERQSLQCIAMHSKLLQLNEDTDLPFSQVAGYIANYRDTLTAAEPQAWCQHVFLPHETMLPTVLLPSTVSHGHHAGYDL